MNSREHERRRTKLKPYNRLKQEMHRLTETISEALETDYFILDCFKWSMSQNWIREKWDFVCLAYEADSPRITSALRNIFDEGGVLRNRGPGVIDRKWHLDRHGKIDEQVRILLDDRFGTPPLDAFKALYRATYDYREQRATVCLVNVLDLKILQEFYH